jgi:hypothetical protein
VLVRCVAYDDRIFSYEAAPTPAKYASGLAVIEPPAPVVKDVRVAKIPGTHEFVQVSWPPALGAKTYIVEGSEDKEHWTRLSTQPSTVANLRIEPGLLYLRVAGVNIEIGPFAFWQGIVGNAVTVHPANVTGLTLDAIGPGFMRVRWNAMANTDRTPKR